MPSDRTKAEFTDALAASPLSKTLGVELCRELVEKGDIVRWKRDSLVFQEGDAGTSLYVILEGRLKLVRFTRDGRETILHFADQYDLIAEAVLFLGKYPVSAMTLLDTTLLRIPSQVALELFERRPEYMRTIFKTMSRWMLRLVEKIDRLALHDARSRLIHYLLELHRQQGEETITFPAKKGEVAALLNMDQATFSRVLRILQDEHWITVQGRTCRLENIPALSGALLAPPPGDF